MTEAIYLEVTEKTEAAKKAGRQVSVSGMLKFLGVSRSGYPAWLHHIPSDTEKRREAVKAKIQDIYDDSKQNYGAPKITVELRKTGDGPWFAPLSTDPHLAHICTNGSFRNDFTGFSQFYSDFPIFIFLVVFPKLVRQSVVLELGK